VGQSAWIYHKLLKDLYLK